VGLFQIMLTLAHIAALPVLLIGLLVCYHVARPQKLPADTSNRINKIRLIWFALSREDWLAGQIEWLRRDELENLTKDETGA
jgi:hypothetical protein